MDMSLHGFERPCARPRGGVNKVELALADELAGFAGGLAARGADPASGIFAEPAAEPFAEYVFREDRATYSETVSGEPLAPLVHRTLTMELPAAPEPVSGSGPVSGSVSGSVSAGQAVAELLEHSPTRGFVARVTLASGEVVVAGWNPRFGCAYPLRVTKLERSSGSEPADFPTLAVTLECTDL